jgi:hypothetical protein
VCKPFPPIFQSTNRFAAKIFMIGQTSTHQNVSFQSHKTSCLSKNHNAHLELAPKTFPTRIWLQGESFDKKQNRLLPPGFFLVTMVATP